MLYMICSGKLRLRAVSGSWCLNMKAVQGLGFWDLGCRVLLVWGLGDLGFRVFGLGCLKYWGLGIWGV